MAAKKPKKSYDSARERSSTVMFRNGFAGPPMLYKDLRRGMIVHAPTVAEDDPYVLEDEGPRNQIEEGTYVLLFDPDRGDDYDEDEWEAHFLKFDPVTGKPGNKPGDYNQPWDAAFRRQRTKFVVIGQISNDEIIELVKRHWKNRSWGDIRIARAIAEGKKRSSHQASNPAEIRKTKNRVLR